MTATNVDQMKKETGDATDAVPDSLRRLDDVTYSAPEELCECTKTNDKCVACVERDSLKCNLCPMVFVDKADIERHLTTSHGGPYAKKRAGDRISTESKKVKVEQAANSSSTHQCKICYKICLSFRGLTRHTATHKNVEVKANCSYCQQTFASEEDKRNHVSDYHRIEVPSEEGVIPNNVCEISVKVDDEKENIKSDVAAGEETEDKKDSKKPTRKRTVKKPEPGSAAEAFVCEDCGKSFEKKSSYVRHKHTHNTSNEFACDICQKQFSSEMVLKRHKSNVHRTKRGKLTDEEDPFSKWYVFADGQKHLKCDQCKYNSLWYHKGRFLEHYRIHTGEKPFTCDLCGKQFRTKTLLQKHVMFVHEGIKEHPCDICGRCFSDKRYMEDHRRIHTGERPYVCDLCGKTFKQSASLFIHKELHKGLRKHGCEMCGKRFTTRSSLTIHIKRHIGERNFICATCGKAFVDGKHLKDHMAVHSEERPFSCELCGGRFKLMKHLKQHGRTHKRDYTT